MKNELKEKTELIRQYQNDILELNERVEDLEGEKLKEKDGKTYNADVRMFVFDAIINQISTNNIPAAIESSAKRNGITLQSVPHRTTVEQMARALAAIGDLKCSEMAMKTKDITLGFDATTQERVHINSVHLTTVDDCEVVAIDELPGFKLPR